MIKHRLSGVMALLSLLFFAVSVVSCVNEEYDMSEDNLNLEVTPFEEGVVLPLGSTEQIKLKELLKDVDADILNVGANGAYSISFSDSFDMTEELSSLKDLIDIPDVDFSEKVTFQMNDVDVSDVKVDAMDYAFEHDLSASVSVPDITMPSVSEKFEVAAGMADFAPSASELKLDIAPVEHEMEFMSLSGSIPAFPGMDENAPISLDNNLLSGIIETSVAFDVEESISMNVSLPKGINSVKEITLSENAALKVTLELVNSFLYSGALVPDVALDLTDVFNLKSVSSDVVQLADKFRLTEENAYKQTVVYPIESLAVTQDDWSRKNADSPYVLDKTFDVKASGDIVFEDLMTTVKQLQDCQNIDVRMVLEFVDLEIADVHMGVDPVEISHKSTVSMSMDDFDIPSEIEEIGNVRFSAASGLDIVVKAQNLDKVRGLEAELETLAIKFPDALVVDGADASNKVVISNVDLVQGVTKHVNIKGINLPAPAGGKIAFDGDVEVEAVANAGGTIHSADLPSKAADDVKIVVEVSSDIEVADYQVKMTGLEYALDIEGEEIKIEVPEELADLSEVVVYPEGTPEVTIDMDLPEMALDIVPSAEGLNIAFPQMLKFKALPASYNYDPVTNSVTFRGSIPSQIKLPVEKLVLVPERDAADGKYYVKGNVEISGGLSLSAGTLSKADVENLSAAGKKISVVAHIPELAPSTIALDSFETAIREEIELEILSAEDMPKEIVSLGTVELENVYLNAALDASALPEIGDASLTVELAVALPEIIKVEGADNNGNITISGKLDDKGMIQIDPIRILALELEGVDLKNGIKDVLVVDGSIKLANASIDVDQWLGKEHEISFNADIKDIVISKVTGKVDYQVDPVVESVDLSDFAQMLGESGAEATLDFYHAHLALEVLTNLGVPVTASVELVPYYDGQADESKIVPATIALNPSESADKESVTRIWLANSEDRMPSGYTFVKADILGLLKNIPEKLEFRLTAATDTERECVLEPTADYSLKANYLFELPLEFGEEFEVTYKTTVDGLPAIVGSLLSNGNKVKIAGEINNALPLGLDLTFNFLDSYGNVVPMADGCGVQKIAPCGLDGSAVKTPLEVVLGLKEGVNSADITSLELVFNANSAGVTGVPVTEDAYLQAVLQLVLPEGITVDLNDILNKEDK